MTARGRGTLYVVATPLGHLGDLSERAAGILRAVSFVAAEDTRRTRKLLSHLHAHTRTVAYHAHSPPRTLEKLLARLETGDDVALVTDAGTPGVSDPGPELVRAAAARGVTVVPVPGPSAVTAALSVSGFSASQYLFLGFLPRRGVERRSRLDAAAASTCTVVLFESPERLGATLQDLAARTAAERAAVVGRELTKRFEEIRRGTLSELAGYYGKQPPRGEVTIVLEGARGGRRTTAAPDPGPMRARVRELLDQGITRRDAARRIAEEFGCSRNEAYRIVTT